MTTPWNGNLHAHQCKVVFLILVWLLNSTESSQSGSTMVSKELLAEHRHGLLRELQENTNDGDKNPIFKPIINTTACCFSSKPPSIF